MKKELYWRFFLNTSKKEKAKRISEEIQNLLIRSKKKNLDIYWKDNNLFCLELKQDLNNNQSLKDLIFEVLKTISLFSDTWTLELPNNFDSDNIEFSGISNENIKLKNLTWISFMLQDQNVSILDKV